MSNLRSVMLNLTWRRQHILLQLAHRHAQILAYRPFMTAAYPATDREKKQTFDYAIRTCIRGRPGHARLYGPARARQEPLPHAAVRPPRHLLRGPRHLPPAAHPRAPEAARRRLLQPPPRDRREAGRAGPEGYQSARREHRQVLAGAAVGCHSRGAARRDPPAGDQGCRRPGRRAGRRRRR